MWFILFFVLTFDFKTFDARNVTTLLAVIGTSSPVLGFLPTLSFFCLTTNVPNDEIFTSSPFIKLNNISLNTESTRFADSFLERPTFLKTASLNVDLVAVSYTHLTLPTTPYV